MIVLPLLFLGLETNIADHLRFCNCQILLCVQTFISIYQYNFIYLVQLLPEIYGGS